MKYPKECFSVDETRTAHNRRLYEQWVEKIHAECVRRHPEYDKMSLCDRYTIYREVVKDNPFML